MKGISPVIATVLLLLMAVASVGGAWIWYQRQSAVIGGETEEKVGEQVEQQTGVSLTLAGLYRRTDGNITLVINNAGSSNVNITGYMISVEGSSTVNTSIQFPIGATTTTEMNTDVACNSNDEVKVQLFAAGISTQKFGETC